MDAWVLGFTIGAAVVLVVVVLLVVLIALASRIGDTAEQIVAALEAARDHTAPLWTLEHVNLTATRIAEGATRAREALEVAHGSGGLGQAGRGGR